MTSRPEPSPPPPPSRPDRGRGIGRELLVVGALAAGLAFWIAGRSRFTIQPPPPSANRPVTITGRATADPRFVGSTTCRDCHPGEHALHSRSGHAHTLRRSGRIEQARALDGRTVDDPDAQGVTWTYRLENDRLVADRREADHIASYVLDFALGSGYHAISFVSVVDGSSPDDALAGIEHRLTYFRDGDRMDRTPGQGAGTPEADRLPSGAKLTPAILLDCLECHATPTATAHGRVDPPTLIPNITCERCHGPGLDHVEAARAGRDDRLAMPFGAGRSSGHDQLTLCGRCHRLPEMVPPQTLRTDNRALARFPSVGLALSACFQGSGGMLSCTTCHDPHARNSNNPEPYETACRSCHGPNRNTTCPINPRTNCLACHMPPRDVGHGMTFHDHWIRADRESPLPENVNENENGTPP